MLYKQIYLPYDVANRRCDGKSSKEERCSHREKKKQKGYVNMLRQSLSSISILMLERCNLHKVQLTIFTLAAHVQNYFFAPLVKGTFRVGGNLN